MKRDCPSGVILLTAIILASQLSCSDSGGPVAEEPIDGKVNVNVFEGHLGYREGKAPAIILAMATEKSYPCCNYSILADVSTVPGIIVVRIAGIHEPGMCLTAFGPATYMSILPVSPGSYRLVVMHNGLTDRYMLDVTGESLRITPGTSNFTVVTSPFCWRIPERSFAYICGTTVETAWMYKSFGDSLLTIPGIREFTFPDSGKVPYPTESSGYWNNEPARYFIYSTEADYDSAGAKLKRFRHNVIGDQQGVGIYLQNWKDVWFMSWNI